jgi:hypothetical protein
MIPTTNKFIQLSPYGLQQAITILLTLNLTIYHIAQVLHFFVDESLESLYSNEVEKWFPFGIHLGHLPF